MCGVSFFWHAAKIFGQDKHRKACWLAAKAMNRRSVDPVIIFRVFISYEAVLAFDFTPTPPSFSDQMNIMRANYGY
jgi:hypothetical protein